MEYSFTSRVQLASILKWKKKKRNLTEASLLHLSSFPCRGKRVEVEAELFTSLAKVPHHRKARNISPKISSGTSGDRLKGKHWVRRSLEFSPRRNVTSWAKSLNRVWFRYLKRKKKKNSIVAETWTPVELENKRLTKSANVSPASWQAD